MRSTNEDTSRHGGRSERASGNNLLLAAGQQAINWFIVPKSARASKPGAIARRALDELVVPLLRLVSDLSDSALISEPDRRLVQALLQRSQEWSSLAHRRLAAGPRPTSATRSERVEDVTQALDSDLKAIARSRLPAMLARESREFVLNADFDHTLMILDGQHHEAVRAVANKRIEPSFEDLLKEERLLADDAAEARRIRPILRGLDKQRANLDRTALVEAAEAIVAVRHEASTPATVHEARIASARAARGLRRRRRR